MNARTHLPRALSLSLLLGLAACRGGGGAAVASGSLAPVSSGCLAGQVALGAGCADTRATAESLRGIVREAMVELDLRSAIVGVSVGDTTVLSQAWGESEAGPPATPDMHWRIGSIGIAYLTTALLQLQDQGLLSIDDKLSKWLPAYPRANDITLAMLANSTSGYAEYVDLKVLPLYADVHRHGNGPRASCCRRPSRSRWRASPAPASSIRMRTSSC